MKGVCTLLFLLAASLFAAPGILSYRADIHRQSETRFAVDLSIRTGAESWKNPAFTLEKGHMQILKTEAASDGYAVSSQISQLGILDRLTIQQPAKDYSVRYVVGADSSAVVRVPLLVPEIPITVGTGLVTITVFSDSADIISGDTFPTFRLSGSGRYVAELSNVPNHVQLSRPGASAAGFRERWMTPARMSDLAVISLILIGSAGRTFARSRKHA